MLGGNLRIANSRPSRVDYRAPHCRIASTVDGAGCRDQTRNGSGICVYCGCGGGWTVVPARADLPLGQVKSGKVGHGFR